VSIVEHEAVATAEAGHVELEIDDATIEQLRRLLFPQLAAEQQSAQTTT
jgi:hypothetical protein